MSRTATTPDEVARTLQRLADELDANHLGGRFIVRVPGGKVMFDINPAPRPSPHDEWRKEAKQ